jgi:molybdopterin-containing oxidoreductase family membrane subunit
MIAIAEVKAVLPQADPHNYDDNGNYHPPKEEIPSQVVVAKSKNA